ncbi:universal stress protein [Pirellulales bacterium]|nr:universal stress protein [Pirellulales bacterium]
MIRRILVGLGDLEHSLTATSKAIEIAQAHNAQLTGVTLFDAERLDDLGIVPIGAGAVARELSETRLSTAVEIIEAVTTIFRNRCEQAGIAYSMVNEEGDPLTSLTSLARYHDLMVVGFQGLFEHGVIDEPDDELAMLVQEGVRPLLAVTNEDRQVERVLIAYSGSMESAKTMKRFTQMRLWPNATLRVITFHGDDQIGADRLAHADEYLRAHDLDPSTECVNAPPHDNLLEYAADWEADLIVMGNSAKSLLLRKILGETALHVMRNSDRALFLAQ